MSLVGTRPPTVDEWELYEPHHRARMSFRPGLTGMWQVSGRSNITDLGDVHVGNGSIIGANAVVLHDVSERCSVAGVPARILHENIDIDEKCNLRKITGK